MYTAAVNKYLNDLYTVINIMLAAVLVSSSFCSEEATIHLCI